MINLKDFVEIRLRDMEVRPKMWALSNEGFIMQVIVLLEVLGVEKANAEMQEYIGSSLGTGTSILREDLSDIFVSKVIVNAKRLIAGLTNNEYSATKI